MGNTYVLATHTCFDDALELLVEIAKRHPDARDDLRLVHGIGALSDGQPFAHAWVEDLKTMHVLFVGLLGGARRIFAAHRDEYYEEIHIREMRAYTIEEVARHNRQSGHYGPWLENFRRLCK